MEGDTASSTTAGAAGSGRQLSQVQISEIRKAFVLCDSDGSGAIDRDELAKALAMLSGSSEGDTESVGRSRHEVEALFSAMDTNGDGVIEWDEFLEGKLFLCCCCFPRTLDSVFALQKFLLFPILGFSLPN